MSMTPLKTISPKNKCDEQIDNTLSWLSNELSGMYTYDQQSHAKFASRARQL